MAIVLPEGIFGHQSYRHVREAILAHGTIIAMFSLPQETFMAGIKSTILIFAKRKIGVTDKVTFVEVQKVGIKKRGKKLEKLFKYDLAGTPLKDENGNLIIDDELTDILQALKKGEVPDYQNMSEQARIFSVPLYDILKTPDLILIPSYYRNREITNPNYFHLTFQELMENGIIQTNEKGNLPAGNEIGRHCYLSYQKGRIPFIRTSDISNLEIKNNPQQFATEEVYQKYRTRQDIKSFDILFVKDGKHLVGECAVVMPEEERIIYASGFYKIRLQTSPLLIQSHILKLRINQKNDYEIDT